MTVNGNQEGYLCVSEEERSQNFLQMGKKILFFKMLFIQFKKGILKYSCLK